MDKKLSSFISTLFHSWGGDTPDEAIWAAEQFAEWLASKNGTTYQYEIDKEDLDTEAFEEEIERIIAYGN